MVCFATEVAAGRKTPQQITRKDPPKKRPLQISEELHSLVSLMAADRNMSLEQVVASAVIKQAKAAPTPPDSEHQILYRQLICGAEEEIKIRYHTERSRRSVQMRKINAERRKSRAAAFPTSTHPTSHLQNHHRANSQGYPVEYRYGFAVPKPPPSSYPTYS